MQKQNRSRMGVLLAIAAVGVVTMFAGDRALVITAGQTRFVGGGSRDLVGRSRPDPGNRP